MKLNFSTDEPVRARLEKDWHGVIHNPPESITPMLWKPKKYGGYMQVPVKVYLTANIWYGSHGSSKNDKIVRASAKDISMFYLNRLVSAAPRCTGKIRVTVVYSTPKKSFDMDNKGYFWGKLFQDYLVKKGRLISDTVEYVTEVHYEYKDSKHTQVEFILTQL